MDFQAAVNLPEEEDPIKVLSTGRIEAISLRSGDFFRVRKITNVNLTTHTVRVLLHQTTTARATARVIPIEEIAQIFKA